MESELSLKYFNDKLSDFRRTLYNELKDQDEKKILKGTRWLLLKNPENLNNEKNESNRLNQALELNKPLSTVYYMRPLQNAPFRPISVSLH